MNWQDFHFIRPEALWLIALLPLFAWFLFKRQGSSQEWAQVCDPELLPYVVEQETSGRQQRHWLWPLILGLPVILALAGPAWQRIPQPVFDETQALVVLLDSSRSMDAEDIKPSRYERAKLKILDLLEMRKTGQTALIAYASEPFVVSPLTTDGKTIAALVPPLKTAFMPRQGSNTVLAVEQAIALLNNAGARGNILLLSDGIEATDIHAAADLAKQAQARISVIGLGSQDGAPIPSAQGFVKDAAGNIVIVKQEAAQLQQLAVVTQGKYSPLTASNQDLERTTKSQDLGYADRLESTEFQADQWREQGPWLLLPLLLIAPLLFRKGVLMLGLIAPIALSISSYSPPAEAFEWRDLFRNQDQRAAARFEQQQFEQSAEQFNHPEWKASAHYRAGDYAAAVEQLQGIDTPQAHYNRGNALAKMGEIDKAISAYKQTLLADKDHADAKHNLKLLENQQQQDDSDSSESSEDSEPSESSDQEQSDQNQQENSEQSEQSEQSQQAEQQDSQQQNADDPSQSQNSSESQEADQQQTSESEEEGEEDQQSLSEQDDESAEDEDAEQNEANYQQQFQDKTEQEVEQATQQWLRRIPDQPGNLLRNQFDNEYRRRQQRGETQNTEEQPW